MKTDFEIPVFPLEGVIVFPGSVLPKYFEKRYLNMIDHCLKTDTKRGYYSTTIKKKRFKFI